MPETILVVAEQQQGKLNRASWETIAAGQAIAAASGWQLEAGLLGAGIGAAAGELAGKKLGKVYALELAALGQYTPDGFVAALKHFIGEKKPHLVLMPHTYQVRDFAPQLAATLGRCLIPDCVGFRYQGGKLVFTRQMFQGKFAADV